MAGLSVFAANRPAPIQALPGFDAVNRFWDRQRKLYVAKIKPGEYYVTLGGELVGTVLGSCVTACIRDSVTGVGGMNHFMLPHHVSGDPNVWAGTQVNAATRYGNYAMEHLINDIITHGWRRDQLEVKIVGGGKILPNMTDVGARDVRFVEEYIRTEGLTLIGEDVGGIHPRKVLYDPETGRSWLKRLRSLHNDTIVKRERKYVDEVEHQRVAGDVELF